jgi:hypothetical protein
MKVRRRLWIAAGVLAAIGVGFVGAVLWAVSSLDGAKALYGPEAAHRLGLPNASRAFIYEAGFTDYASWVAFSADKETIERFITGSLKLQLDAFSPWPSAEGGVEEGKALPPISPPGRWEWLNRGLWDISPESNGLFFQKNIKEMLQVFYDTDKQRVYVVRMVP